MAYELFQVFAHARHSSITVFFVTFIGTSFKNAPLPTSAKVTSQVFYLFRTL